MSQIILVKLVRKFYDNKGNIYEIYKKRNNHYYLTVTNKNEYKKIIANTKNEILKILKSKYQNNIRFSDKPILNIENYKF